jgi:hypothetical protein
MRGDEGQGAGSDDEFTEALADLKAEGCNLLVVGTVPEEATARVCRRMLGDVEAGRRERLLVFTDAATDAVTNRLPHAPGEPTPPATLIDHAATARSAVADQGTAAGPRMPPDVNVRRVESDGLGELGTAISRAIDDLARDDPDPGEVRVCVDSLSPLLEGYDEGVVFRFLHVLTGRVRQAKGLAHFHLPVQADAREARLLAPLFDAVVEVRMADGLAEQRWRLRDGDVETDWLAV